jgi:hypothetical protein
MKSYQKHEQTRTSIALFILSVVIAVVCISVAFLGIKCDDAAKVFWADAKTSGKELKTYVTRLISSGTTSS